MCATQTYNCSIISALCSHVENSQRWPHIRGEERISHWGRNNSRPEEKRQCDLLRFPPGRWLLGLVKAFRFTGPKCKAGTGTGRLVCNEAQQKFDKASIALFCFLSNYFVELNDPIHEEINSRYFYISSDRNSKRVCM